MKRKSLLSFAAGFFILFALYHFPEFFPSFWLMAVCKIGFLLVAYIMARLQGWKGLGGYGLGFTTAWAARLGAGLLIGIIAFTASILFSVAAGYEKINGFAAATVIIKQLPLLLLLTAVPSVAEDILTRGYLYGHLKDKISKYSWIFLSATVFLLNHIWRLNDGAAVLSYLFFMGLVLALAVWKTKSLWLAFGIHWGSNLAFESSNALMKSESLVKHEGGTWMLAGVWVALFLVLLVLRQNKKANV